MNILYKKLKNGESMNLLDRFLEIKEELLEDRNDLLNRYEYYTKKHRGNRLNDINVGIYYEPGNKFTVQIFLQNKTGFVRNKVTFNSNFKIVEDNLRVKLNG